MGHVIDNQAFFAALLRPVEVPEDQQAVIEDGLAEEAADILEARHMVTKLQRAADESRTGIGNAIRLSEPGCDRGCRECYRACAVARISLHWWEKELCSLTGGLVR